MKIKHLVACISLCTLLNFSNGYTANNTQLTLDDLNGAEISIFDNSDFWNQKVHIYTKPTEHFSKIKVHKYFGDPSSEEVEVTNNNGFFQIAYDFLKSFKDTYDNATYGIAEYQGNYYAVLLSDNMKVDDTVWSKLVSVVDNQNNNKHLDLLQRIPIQNTYKIKNDNLEDEFLGKGKKIFLVRSWLGGIDWKDGPMTFYANPPEKLNTIKAHTRFLWDDGPEINVRNNNGKFDISKGDLIENDPLLYNKSYKENLNYGILKYNNQYYLVNYEIDNINNSAEKFKIFPLGGMSDAFEIQYLDDEEQYNNYYHQIHNVNYYNQFENNNSDYDASYNEDVKINNIEYNSSDDNSINYYNGNLPHECYYENEKEEYINNDRFILNNDTNNNNDQNNNKQLYTINEEDDDLYINTQEEDEVSDINFTKDNKFDNTKIDLKQAINAELNLKQAINAELEWSDNENINKSSINLEKDDESNINNDAKQP